MAIISALVDKKAGWYTLFITNMWGWLGFDWSSRGYVHVGL